MRAFSCNRGSSQVRRLLETFEDVWGLQEEFTRSGSGVYVRNCQLRVILRSPKT